MHAESTRRRTCRGPISALRHAVVLALVAALSLIAQPAWAHGGATSAPQAVTFDMGQLQVRAVIGTVSQVPAVVLIDLSVTTPTAADVPVTVRAWPSAGPRPAEPAGVVRLLAGDAGPYPTQVQVDRIGPWDIELALPEATGAVSVGRIPITVAVPPGDPAEPGRSLSYVAAALLAVAGTSVAILMRRRSPRMSGVALSMTGPATATALAVAVTLSVVTPAPPVPVGGAGPAGPPHVNVGLSALDSAPVSGRPSTLEFLLTDGSTGRPVDDVTPHHEALLHVAIIGESVPDFAHVHPTRTSPGRYLLDWTPAGAGQHVVEVELARGLPDRSGDLGTQVIRRTVQVDPTTDVPPSGPAEVGGLGARQIAGLDVDVQATGALVAGTPIGLRATVTDAGRPAALLPWLGMDGHLMVRDRRADSFAHVHAVGPMSPAPTLAGTRTDTEDPLIEQMRAARAAAAGQVTTSRPEASPSGDSEIDFAYTFPVAGRYDAWMQFRHGDRVVTVPMSLEIAS